MNQISCPACEGNAFVKCESIDVIEQHRSYAPDNLELQQKLNAAVVEAAANYQMLKCLRCGLEFCDPLRAPTTAWYGLAYRALSLHALNRWEFHEVISRFPEDARIFEFGCGSGQFLSLCKERGLCASGMDFSADGVASCIAKGLNVRQVELDAINAFADSERVSHMAAFHFLEHLERPAALFQHAAARAMPWAHLWISVPSNNRATRHFGTRDFLDQPPHHMSRWTPEALREVGKRFGWRLAGPIYEPISHRDAIWWIAVNSSAYKRRQAAGRLSNRYVERAYRLATLPIALVARFARHKALSGFSILAHFVFEGEAVTACRTAASEFVDER